MRRWVSTLVIAAVFASLAWTGRWWKPWLLDLLDAQGARIQALADLAQLALWVFAGLALIANFLRREKPEAKQEQPSTRVEARDRSVAVGGSVTGSNVITGDHNVVSQDSNVVNQPQQFRDLVMQQTVIQRSETTTLSPLHQLPPPPHDFTGREQELTELLAATERGSVISGLQGLGGVGKTALALKLAERLKARCPDAQFYLDLRGSGERPVTPAEAMAHVIRAYHPTARLPESEAELRPLFFSALHGQRALLLMDNAKDKEQVEPLIPPAGCVLLVTSRQHFKLPGMFDQKLDTLPRADAIKLLLNIAARIGDQADEIARLCGDLPLALRVAAGALAERPNLAPADYVRRLADAKQRLSHLKEVDVALNVSYEMLNEEQRRWWRALAVFPQTFDDEAAAAVWEMERDAAQDALGDLMKWSLVEFSDETGRYRLHDLARLFAEARLSVAGAEETNAAQRRFALHYRTVLETCNSLYLEGNESVLRGLALFDQEWSNIQAGRAWAEARIEKDGDAAQLCIDYPNTGAYILELRQHPRERIHWLEVQLAASRQLKRRDYESYALGNLGIAWDDLGKTRKAIEFYEQALTIAREIGDHKSEGNALGSLGNAWAALGETRKAIEFHEQYLAIAREIGDRRGEGNALGNLGIAWAALGETRKAIEFYEQVLTIAREIGDRRGEGNALGNLSNAWADLGETQKAIDFNEQSLTIAREIGDREGEGNALWNMSLDVDKLGDRARVIALAEAALKIYEAIESPAAEKARRQLAKWRGQAGTE
jgi:tetratricopeptide (TPR) repeat protein